MPFINNKHFRFAIANFEENKFYVIDPMGSSIKLGEHYLIKFKNFINFYNEYHKQNYMADKLKPTIYKHILQKDNFHCGAFIIYIFGKICKNENPQTPYDMSKYRKDIKSLLINSAPNMVRQCLFCARDYEQEEFVQCKSCQRYIHISCSKNENHNCYLNKLCDICRIY